MIEQDDTPPENTFLTTEEAAAFLRMTPRMLSKRRWDGKISCFKDGNAITFSVSQLVQYQKSIEEPMGCRKTNRRRKHKPASK